MKLPGFTENACLWSLVRIYPKIHWIQVQFSSVQFISVAQSCLTLCDPMNRSTPGLPVHHQLLDPGQGNVNKQTKKELYLLTGFSSGLKIRKHLKNTKEKLTVQNIICIPSLNGFIPLFIYLVLIWSKGRHSWLLKKSETVITRSGFQHPHFP